MRTFVFQVVEGDAEPGAAEEHRVQGEAQVLPAGVQPWFKQQGRGVRPEALPLRHTQANGLAGQEHLQTALICKP